MPVAEPTFPRFVVSFVALTIVASMTCSLANAQLPTGWRAHDKSRPLPTVIDAGPETAPANVPSDAIVLFDGTDMSKWRNAQGGEAGWKVVDGAMESVKNSGYVYTKQEFGDMQLHIEWASPASVKGNGQGRGNSGVFLMGEFEVQVLDSFENTTYSDGQAGAIYGQYPPLVNASRRPGQWQSYDIIFHTPRVDEEGNQTKPATITVLHNGVLIQDHSIAFGPTSWIQRKEPSGKVKGSLGLQDHGNPVRFRNIWVRPIGGAQPEPPTYPAAVEMAAEDLEKYVGKFGNAKFELVDGVLKVRQLGTYQELVPQGDHVFGMLLSAGKIKFEVKDGVAKSVKIQVDAAGERTLEREE